MTAKVTVEDVQRVAELAHLELKPEETPAMLRDLNAILDYVAELNQLDTTGVVPLAQVSELVDAACRGVLREDVLQPSIDRAAVLSQAPKPTEPSSKSPRSSSAERPSAARVAGLTAGKTKNRQKRPASSGGETRKAELANPSQTR